jgi:hypothetical protein
MSSALTRCFVRAQCRPVLASIDGPVSSLSRIKDLNRLRYLDCRIYEVELNCPDDCSLKAFGTRPRRSGPGPNSYEMLSLPCMDRSDIYPQPSQRSSAKACSSTIDAAAHSPMNDVTNTELTPRVFLETPRPLTNKAGGFFGESGLCENHVCRLLTSLSRNITLPSARKRTVGRETKQLRN